MSVCLACTFDDVEGRLLGYVCANSSVLTKIYNGQIAVSATKRTSLKIISALKAQGIEVSQNKTVLSRGENYRKAASLGLKFKPLHIHFVDLDRVLHWAANYPDELAAVVKKTSEFKGFLALNRTRRAFLTHPKTQRLTENVINEVSSKLAGKNIDIMSGGYGFDYDLAKLFARESKVLDFGIYVEFLAIALKHKAPINMMNVEGLEWETPDRFQKEIKNMGYKRWLGQFESFEEWERRIGFISESMRVF